MAHRSHKPELNLRSGRSSGRTAPIWTRTFSTATTSPYTARPGNWTVASRTLFPSLTSDTLEMVTEARDLTTDSSLEPDELVWLNECLVEYRELLAYLREH